VDSLIAFGSSLAADAPPWFPRLQRATPDQRRRWRLIGGGVGLHWEDVDEDISVESLLTTKPLLVGAV